MFCPADILQIVMWSKELYSCCSCYVLGSSSPTSSSQNGWNSSPSHLNNTASSPGLHGWCLLRLSCTETLRPFDRISLSGGGGGGAEGGKGGRGGRGYGSTRRSWIILLSSPRYHQKRHLGTWVNQRRRNILNWGLIFCLFCDQVTRLFVVNEFNLF